MNIVSSLVKSTFSIINNYAIIASEVGFIKYSLFVGKGT